MPQEYAALAQGLASIYASAEHLDAKVKAEEQDLRRIEDMFLAYKAVDGRVGAARIHSHSDFPQE